MNRLQRFPEWLRAAFRLADPELPVQLSTAEIVPTVDVLQGGLPTMLPVDVSGVDALVGPVAGGGWYINTAGESTVRGAAPTTITPTKDYQALAYVEIGLTGGAAIAVVAGLYFPEWGSTIDLHDASLAPADVLRVRDFHGQMSPLWIPPGALLYIGDTGLAAGQTLNPTVGLLRFDGNVQLQPW